MDAQTLNFIQTVDLSKYPFRQNLLDYSHLPYANILDGIAASFLMWVLAALFFHVIALILGMSTRLVVVSSLLERYFFPNVFHATKLNRTTSEKLYSVKTYNVSQLIAGSLLFLLLALEGVVIFSASLTNRKISLEQLRIKIPKFVPYEGDVRFQEFPQSSMPLLSAGPSINAPEINFNVRVIHGDTQIDDEGIGFISLLLGHWVKDPSFSYTCFVNNNKFTWVFWIQLNMKSKFKKQLYVNSTRLVTDTHEMSI